MICLRGRDLSAGSENSFRKVAPERAKREGLVNTVAFRDLGSCWSHNCRFYGTLLLLDAEAHCSTSWECGVTLSELLGAEFSSLEDAAKILTCIYSNVT